MMTSCPVPSTKSDKILMAHGGGGKLTTQLIEKLFLPAFGGSSDKLHDGAYLSVGGKELAFTTDSYVVKPLFFPGGNIGDLAVNGTVNDLAMCGARPLYLSCGFILEEGLEIASLEKIVDSMRRAAEAAGVQLVTGDTKVVERSSGGGVYINTAGIGEVVRSGIAPQSIQSGDAILISGDLGRHGTAVMSVREGLSFDSEIESDSQELASLVMALMHAGVEIHCMRDLTRGGLATVLAELSQARGLGLCVEEEKLPVDSTVRGACEFLGLDPLYVACEGRMLAIVDPAHQDHALNIMRRFNSQAAIVGSVSDKTSGRATARTCLGTQRILDALSGDQLPRIC